MTKVVGTGKNGKRLWIRTPDNRWAPIPYGAGEDPKVRSFNVWDGQKWMSPGWGWSIYNNYGEDRAVDSLSIRAPGVTWPGALSENAPGHHWNPNWIQRSANSLQFAPIYPDWLRLFQARPRTDPAWRIIPISGNFLPAHIPNRTVHIGTGVANGSSDLRLFWPSFTARQVAITDGVVTDSTQINDSTVPQPYLAFAAKGQNRDPVGLEYGNTLTNLSAIIDLESIRKRLELDFEFRNGDYTGQYHSIKNQLTRRVVAGAYLEVSINAEGAGTGPSDFFPEDLLDGVTINIRTRSNVPTTKMPASNAEFLDLTYRREMDVNVPDDTSQSSGPVLKSYSTNQYTPFRDNLGPPTNTKRISFFWTDSLEWLFEAPGDNNIAFYLEITGLPVASTATGIDRIYARASIEPRKVNVHYADEGKDTPSDTHNSDSIM